MAISQNLEDNVNINDNIYKGQNYYISNSKIKNEIIKKITKSRKQEKIKVNLNTIYGYEKKNEKMGSRKRNRWNNDNFINHPIASQYKHEAQDINTKYVTVNPSPFTKLTNLQQYGINVSSFLDINDDRQKTFLKRISKYTDTIKIIKRKESTNLYGPENLTKLDRRLKQKLAKRPTMMGIINEYEKRIRKILTDIQKEQQSEESKENNEEIMEKNTVINAKNENIKQEIKKTKMTKPINTSTTKTASNEKTKLDLKEIKLNKIEKQSDNVVHNNLIVVWAIENEFHRLLVHTLCRWYGIISYSKDDSKGNRYTFIEVNTEITNINQRLENTISKYIYH